MTKSFQQQLDDAYQKKVVERLEQAVRYVSLWFWGDVKLNTPVDTSRARSNWHIDLNSIQVRFFEPNEGQTADAASSVIASYKLGQTVFISNNLPYIARLNDGYSLQAPAGFVQDSVVRAENAANRKYSK